MVTINLVNIPGVDWVNRVRYLNRICVMNLHVSLGENHDTDCYISMTLKFA